MLGSAATPAHMLWKMVWWRICEQNLLHSFDDFHPVPTHVFSTVSFFLCDGRGTDTGFPWFDQ